MTVVVTDHHEVPFEDTEEGRKYKLPLADAIINPKQSDCTYPNKNICGAVVAMKLVLHCMRNMESRRGRKKIIWNLRLSLQLEILWTFREKTVFL